MALTQSYRQHTILKRLRADSVVLDCGANHGDFAKLVNHLFGCRVYAVEPNPKLFAALPTSDRIAALNYAVTASNGPIELTLGEDDESSSTVARPANAMETVRVEGRTLESLLNEIGVDVVDLVKLDIEGSEIASLMGADDRTLSRIRQLTVEFHDFCRYVTDQQVDDAIRRVESAGFVSFAMERRRNGRGDVLFVNQRHEKLSPLQIASIRTVERNSRIVGRRLKRFWHETVLRRGPYRPEVNLPGIG